MKRNDYVKQRFQYSVILWSSFYLNYRAWVFLILIIYHFCTFWKILYSSGVRDQFREKGEKCVFLLQDPSLFEDTIPCFVVWFALVSPFILCTNTFTSMTPQSLRDWSDKLVYTEQKYTYLWPWDFGCHQGKYLGADGY